MPFNRIIYYNYFLKKKKNKTKQKIKNINLGIKIKYILANSWSVSTKIIKGFSKYFQLKKLFFDGLLKADENSSSKLVKSFNDKTLYL